jgi:hypothetical protein
MEISPGQKLGFDQQKLGLNHKKNTVKYGDLTNKN